MKKKTRLELDPRHYWVILLSVVFLIIAAELIYFSLVFLRTTEKIDAPAIPTLETNAIQIKTINRTLDGVESALEKRIGAPVQAEEDVIIEE